MDTSFCVEALQEALAKYGQPDIFNSDQGSQFTADAFTAPLKAIGVQISMDGRGAWRDSVFVERLWKSVKYEEVYLHAYDSVAQAKMALAPRRDTSTSTTRADPIPRSTRRRRMSSTSRRCPR